MVRDLAEFGRPNAVINTSKISFASIRKSHENPIIVVQIVCDGAFIPFEFLAAEEESAEAMFHFFKSCVENNT